MKRQVLEGSVVAGLLTLSIVAQTSQQIEFSGVITGQVLNEEGRVVVKARVCADPPMLAWVGELPCDRSDAQGRFAIRVWRPAEYIIKAEKEREGYPDTSNTFYGPLAVALPRVIIVEYQTQHEVTILLGPPYGKLTGKIFDAETGQPIESVRMNLHHANNPANSLALSTGYRRGRLRLLVPPVAVIFKISATGYHDWWYGADGTEERAEALQVEPYSTRDLIIPLRPINQDK